MWCGHTFPYVFTSARNNKGFPGGSDDKESSCNTGEPGSIPGSGKAPGERNGYPLQFSCLENSMDRGACWATVHGIAKSRTRLANTHTGITSLFHLLNTQAKRDSLPVFSWKLLCALRRVKPEVGGHNTARQHLRRSHTPALCTQEGPCDLAREMWTEVRGPLQAKA